MIKKNTLNLAAGVVLTGISFMAVAENATHIPGYTIHHNALTTDTLSPQVAKAYNIQRSKSRGMLNVSVVKDQAGSLGQPVKAKVEARATNLSGQSREIDLREISDGDAIYYIGDFRVANQETLNFKLQVEPQGAGGTYSAKLSQQFFTE